MAPRKRGGTTGPFEPRADSITQSDGTGMDATGMDATGMDAIGMDAIGMDGPESGSGLSAGAPSQADPGLSGPASPAWSPDPAPMAFGLDSESAPPATILPEPEPEPEPASADAATSGKQPAESPAALPSDPPAFAPQPAPDAVTASASAIGSVTGLGLAAFVGGGFLMMGLGAAVGAYYSVALAEQYVRRIGGPGRQGAA